MGGEKKKQQQQSIVSRFFIVHVSNLLTLNYLKAQIFAQQHFSIDLQPLNGGLQNCISYKLKINQVFGQQQHLILTVFANTCLSHGVLFTF